MGALPSLVFSTFILFCIQFLITLPSFDISPFSPWNIFINVTDFKISDRYLVNSSFASKTPNTAFPILFPNFFDIIAAIGIIVSANILK